MKAISKLLLTIALPAFVFSCSETPKEESTPAIEETNKVEEISHEGDGELRLDNGKLWVANPETTTGIQNMKVLMDAFMNNQTIEAYTSLQESLENEFSLIFKNCTMTGEAHDQLHNYLLPMKGYMKRLTSDELETRMFSYSDLRTHLENYSKYFKTEAT